MAGLTSSRRWITALALLATLHLLLFYGVPGGIQLAILIALGIFYFRAGPLPAVATTLSLGVATLFCSFAIHLLGLDKAMYYRPHEQLVQQNHAEGHRAYRKNARIEMTAPHGDLKALTSANLAQPRKVVFQTDSAGFRNDRDYADGDLVLIGDSFVVGMGDSQADTLSAQLTRELTNTRGIKAYNLGHPGDISDYLSTWRAFRRQHPGPVRAALFLFEGNDFEAAYKPAKTEKPSPLARYAGEYYGFFTGSDLYRVTKSLYARATKAGGIAASDSVRIETLAGQKMGLYTPYISVSERTQYTLPAPMQADLIALAGEVEQVFFIPTNYRVYARHLGAPTLPHAQWQALSKLCEQQRWRCTDLTPGLVAASDAALTRGQFIWWLDDTHWNRAGIKIAAEVVAQKLGSHAAH
ncbi:MAG: hypothetical protein B7Y41_06380 [Hydrogenophilales bacterium 28-61-23]|nr:MAG: hypothetical protein B7Y41_06380 [Hydrogenophilales bacterium 28-61-23]